MTSKEAKQIEEALRGVSAQLKSLGENAVNATVLKAFGADIFFDDQQVHIESARAHVASAHVPNGIVNEVK